MSLTALFLIHTEFLAEFSPNISPYMKEKKKKKTPRRLCFSGSLEPGFSASSHDDFLAITAEIIEIEFKTLRWVCSEPGH